MGKLSPRNAENELQVISLNTDNFSTKDFWILTDSYNITITRQRNGEPERESMTIPRRDFNRLVDWYFREQKIIKEK